MIRIGTRASALALAQASWVAERIEGQTELVPVSTSGDRNRESGDKSRWVSELEQALLTDEIDLAVHSAKDVPAELAEGLAVLAIPTRADPRDVICGAPSLGELASEASVGTSSLRRTAQLKAARPDLNVIPVRGNVDTRLRKLRQGEVDALVLAAAGLERLGRGGEAGGAIGELVPAAGQGALLIEGRTRVAEGTDLSAVSDHETAVCVTAERELVHALDASCNTPVGAHAAWIGPAEIELAAWVGMPDGSEWISDRIRGAPHGLAAALAERMLAVGAAELLGRAEREAGGVTVYLVGAGPGDIDLMTARSLELIAAADVIIHDRLIPDQALAGAREDVKLIYVGKEGGGPSMPQAEIEALLLEHGRAGRAVVRLKGGDPFVFGRGGEEAEALKAAGIAFEVVPGVTAGVAATAYAGIPVTHRDLASAVAFVTGHEDPDKPESALDWRALGAFPGTLVLYMAVRQLGAIAERLIAAGRDPSEPAAVVQRGTFPDQRVVGGTLATVAAEAGAAGIRAPAIAVIGAVAELRDRLGWFDRRPLSGITVAVTRARAQASGLASRLEALGAAVVQAPAIRIVPLPGPPPDLARYDLVCLTSPNGVRLLFERMAGADLDARALAGCRVAAIGPGTAAELRRHGVIADVVPERYVAEGLLDVLRTVPVRRVLIARAADARDVLPEALRERGAEVEVLPLYETRPERLGEDQRAGVASADYITFTSSSTVRYFVQNAGEALPSGARLVSIGPVTSATLREHGLEPHVEATRHDIDGVIEALAEDVEARRAQAPAVS